jgi:hypothetical protein
MVAPNVAPAAVPTSPQESHAARLGWLGSGGLETQKRHNSQGIAAFAAVGATRRRLNHFRGRLLVGIKSTGTWR